MLITNIRNYIFLFYLSKPDSSSSNAQPLKKDDSKVITNDYSKLFTNDYSKLFWKPKSLIQKAQSNARATNPQFQDLLKKVTQNYVSPAQHLRNQGSTNALTDCRLNNLRDNVIVTPGGFCTLPESHKSIIPSNNTSTSNAGKATTISNSHQNNATSAGRKRKAFNDPFKSNKQLRCVESNKQAGEFNEYSIN